MNPDFYDKIELNEEELKIAILEGKKKKFFHERNAHYWEKQESKKGKTEMISHEVGNK